MRRQVRILQPKSIVPFASFVWFSHQDNYYMNQSVNKIADIAAFCAAELKVPPVVLYPGDTWDIGVPHDSSAALASYEADYAAMFQTPLRDESAVVSDVKLREAAAAFVSKAQRRNNRLLLRLIPGATAYLTDKNQTVRISFSGLVTVPETGPAADISLDSDSLAYCFLYGWGADTLHVNGRYQVPRGGNSRRFFRIFRVASMNMAEEYLDVGFVPRKIIQRARFWLSSVAARS